MIICAGRNETFLCSNFGVGLIESAINLTNLFV